MNRIPILASLVLSFILGFQVQSCFAQSEQTEGMRKVTNKVVPAYPQMARSMNLSGTVKLAALVLANGTVKSVEVKGGNPLLAQPAQSAVGKWKWEKSDRETTEFLEFHFSHN